MCGVVRGADSYAFEQLELAAAYMGALAEDSRGLTSFQDFGIVCTKLCIESEKVPAEKDILKQVERFDVKGERELKVVILRPGGGFNTHPLPSEKAKMA